MLDGQLHRFRIGPDESGRTVVEVDGEPVTGVIGYRVEATLDHPVPTLTLALNADGHLDGEGIVRVVDDVDTGQAVAEFLTSIDAEQLEREALRSHATGGSLTPTLLMVLAAYARGDR